MREIVCIWIDREFIHDIIDSLIRLKLRYHFDIEGE